MNDEPLLLTPGPLTTSKATKAAMLRDWGSRDVNFIDLTSNIKQRLEEIVGVNSSNPRHVCVPIQGSGTYAIEAVINTLMTKSHKVLVLINGAYGRRIAAICKINGRAYATLETKEDVTPNAEQVNDYLKNDPEISHVAVVHCETTSGILNPINDIARVVAKNRRLLIIDAMSSFGAIPLNLHEITCAAIVASSNKCLEGVPGIGFAIIETDILCSCRGNATSLSLDLFEQWQCFKNTGQWRFTPPTHVLAALNQALIEHEVEGGVHGRGLRYQKNCQTLIEGMTELGFETYLTYDWQSFILVTFLFPRTNNFDFNLFYDKLKDRGFAIYPGKLTKVDSFRIGCIGHLNKNDITNAITAVAAVMVDLG
jgi:2-aminoethylphosphonate-pyruvate transaminase